MLKLKLLQNTLHLNTAALTSKLEKSVQSSAFCYREAHLHFNVLKCKKKKKDKRNRWCALRGGKVKLCFKISEQSSKI